MQIKMKMGSTTHLLESRNIQKTDTTKCCWVCEAIGALHPLLAGIQNSITTLEDNVVVSYKTNHILAFWSNNWYLPKRAENLYPQENLQLDI
jgi:hypothetical protein